MSDKAWDERNERFEIEAKYNIENQMRQLLKNLSDYEALYNVYSDGSFIAVKRGSTIKREIEQMLVSGDCYRRYRLEII